MLAFELPIACEISYRRLRFNLHYQKVQSTKWHTLFKQTLNLPESFSINAMTVPQPAPVTRAARVVEATAICRTG